MIKIIFEIDHINYDRFLENVLKQAKEHPELMGGAKLPPFSDKMLKMLPADKKNEMFAQVINTEKERLKPGIAGALARLIGPVEIYDMAVSCNGSAVTAQGELCRMDLDYFIQNFMPRYYDPVHAAEMLGENYTGSHELSSVQAYMFSRDFKEKQFLVAKSISVNKVEIMRFMDIMAAQAGVELRMGNIRIMVR